MLTGWMGNARAQNNVVLLFAAFAVGQGALFVAQTWLVVQGQLGFVGLFGTSFTFATLAYYVVDWGGLILLARHELAEGQERGSAAFFWSLSLVRALVALTLVAAIAAWSALGGDGFSADYAIAVVPALLIGAFNAGGVLDGLNRSGLTGFTTMLPVFVSAAALPVASLLPGDMQGYFLGSAFSLGTILSVLLQFAALKRFGKSLPFTKPDPRSIAAAGREGGAVLLSLMPGYSFYRIQVALSAWLLGPLATGMFIYAKQVVNGVQQMVYFVRRADLPKVVSAITPMASLADVARVQRTGLRVAALLAAMVGAIGLGAWLFTDGAVASAGLMAATFSVAIFLSSSYGALHQAYVVAHRAGTAAFVANIGFILGTALSAAGVALFGVYALPVAETLMAAFVLLALMRLWSRPATAPLRIRES